MKIFTEIAGNLHDPLWRRRAAGARIEYLEPDQWTAQKSRFVLRSDAGNTYAVALRRHTQLADGDILEYRPEEHTIVALRIRLNDVLVLDLSSLEREPVETAVRIAVETGHAIGNQHWPAVVKGLRIYVPLTVDRKVMQSVMETHRLEGVACSFQPGEEIVPYLAPHEIRRLFGGSEPHGHSHEHNHGHAPAHGREHEHDHAHGHVHTYDRAPAHDREHEAPQPRTAP